MSLRQRILALAVGATASVMVLFAIPLWLLLDRSASEEGREGAVAAARGVADYLSTGSTQRQVLEAYVDRLNARENRATLTLVLPAGSLIGAEPPEAAPPDAYPRGPDEKDDGDEDNALTPVSEPEVDDIAGRE